MKAKAFKMMKAANPGYLKLMANQKAIKAAEVLAAKIVAAEVIAAKLQNDHDLEKEKLISCLIKYHAICKLATLVDAKNELHGGMMSSCQDDTVEEPQLDLIESINSTSAAVQV